MINSKFKEEGYTEYHGDKRGTCPYCDNTELVQTDTMADYEELIFYYICPNCGGAVCDYFDLKYSGTNVIIEDK